MSLLRHLDKVSQLRRFEEGVVIAMDWGKVSLLRRYIDKVSLLRRLEEGVAIVLVCGKVSLLRRFGKNILSWNIGPSSPELLRV